MVQSNVTIPDPPVYPFININTNKVEYLTDAQSAVRDDIRHIRPGERITPDQMPGTSAPPPVSS